jgi:hypothetical protein
MYGYFRYGIRDIYILLFLIYSFVTSDINTDDRLLCHSLHRSVRYSATHPGVLNYLLSLIRLSPKDITLPAPDS